MSADRRTYVVLNLSAHVPDLITQGRHIVAALTNNPRVPALNQVATCAGHIDELEVAETATKTKAKGTVATRNAKKRVVVADLHQLKSCVQAAADADPENAAAIIASCGMSVRKTAAHPKQQLAAWSGDLSGLVHVTAPVTRSRAAYQWQMSTDQKTWTTLPATLKARTTVAALTPGIVYYFRFRTVTKAGESDWSQIVGVLAT